MKTLIAVLSALLLYGGQAFAQTSTAAEPSTQPSDAKKLPLEGANSFTEGQARTRIENAGFSQIAELKKDGQGVWRGTAVKDGKSVAVALDFKGNIVHSE